LTTVNYNVNSVNGNFLQNNIYAIIAINELLTGQRYDVIEM